MGLAVPTFTLKTIRSLGAIENYLRFHEAMLSLREDCSRVPHPFAAIQRLRFNLVQALG